MYEHDPVSTPVHTATLVAEALAEVTHNDASLDWEPSLATCGDVSFTATVVENRKSRAGSTQTVTIRFIVTIFDSAPGTSLSGLVERQTMLEIPSMCLVQNKIGKVHFSADAGVTASDLGFKIKHALTATWTEV